MLITEIKKYKDMDKRIMLLEKQKFLINNDLEYSLKICNSRYSLDSKVVKQQLLKKKSILSPQELGFVRRVRNYIKKNEFSTHENFKEELFKEDIEYIKVRPYSEPMEMVDLIEIDINNAYWDSAYLLGLLSDELHSEGLEKWSKKARLIALGSLAKNEYEYKFKGTKKISERKTNNPFLTNLWYHICKKVSDAMLDVMELSKDKFAFYWVDGIYIKNNHELKVDIVKRFSDYGFESKIKAIDKVDFKEKNFIVHDDLDNEKTRKFNYTMSKDGVKKLNSTTLIKSEKFYNQLKDKNFSLQDEIKKQVKEMYESVK